MAYCITSSSPSYCPQVQLDVVEDSHTDINFTFRWTLKYVAHGYPLYTDGAGRAWSVKIDGSTAQSGSFNINGIAGTSQIATGTYTVTRYSTARDVAFSLSFNFNATFSGTALGTRSASGSYNIGATTSYTVSYNANGGSGAPASQTKWHSVTLSLSSTKPTRTGYTFKSWNTSSDGSGTTYYAGGTYTANASRTLYAQWTENTYTVSYNANGGSGAPSSQTKYYTKNLTLSPTAPTRTGYTFAGWNTKADGTGTNYSAGGTYSTNAAVTLYAKWTLITYKVTYNANGGSGAPGQQTKNYGQTLTLSSTKPTKTNYNFMGWATSATGSVVYSSGSAYTDNAAITLYAVWELASSAPSISNFTISRKSVKKESNLLSDTNHNSLTKKAASANRYWENTNFTNVWPDRQIVKISDSPCDAEYGARLTCDGTQSTTNYYSSLVFYNGYNVFLQKGKYVGSFYARTKNVSAGVAGARTWIAHSGATSDKVLATHEFTSSWKRYEFSLDLEDYENGESLRFYIGSVASIYHGTPFVGTVEIIGWKLESGNEVTDWVPSFEDVVAADNGVYSFNDVLEDDPFEGDIALVDFDYSFDQSAGQNYGNEISYTLSTLPGRKYLDSSYGFDTHTNGHIQFQIESVTNALESTLYLRVEDDNGMYSIKYVILPAGKYWIDYYDNDEVGVAIGMPSGEPGFNVGIPSKFRNDVDVNGVLAPKVLKCQHVYDIDDVEQYLDTDFVIHHGYFDGSSMGTKPFGDGFVDTHCWRPGTVGNQYIHQTAYEDNYRTIAERAYSQGSGWSAWRYVTTEDTAFLPFIKESSSATWLVRMMNVFNRLPEGDACYFKVLCDSQFTCIGHRYSGGAYGSMLWLNYDGDIYIFRRINNVDDYQKLNYQRLKETWWATASKMDYRRCGNLVYVNCYQDTHADIAAASTVSVGTLPSDCRPTHSNHHAIGHVSGYGHGSCNVTVNKDGTVTVVPFIKCTEYDFSTVFFIE